jgi:DNA-directed RNA polymerase specialized sigma24 family protein
MVKNEDIVTETQKTGQEALILVDRLLQATTPKQKLNDLQSAVFLQTWAGYSYLKIAEQLDYKYDYIKQVGSLLWQNLSQVLGEPVSKHNIHSVLRRSHTEAQINDNEVLK